MVFSKPLICRGAPGSLNPWEKYTQCVHLLQVLFSKRKPYT